MAKDPERDQLIARLEAQAREDPDAYGQRLTLLAALGYGYIGLVLLLTVAVLAGLVAILAWSRGRGIGVLLQLFIPALAFAFALVRGLWVRFPSPEGIRLDSDAFPSINRLVEEARVLAQAPRVHRMLLTPDLNAAVAQVPRLGLLGWPRNYLLLGLPLLDGLSLDEVRAVLAHEFGHLSSADGALGGWLYRTRAAWAHLAEQLQDKNHVGTVVLGWFFARYQPFFDAYSFVAARAQERLADQFGARLAGSRAMADALARLPLLTQALDGTYWPAVYGHAAASPAPAARPFSDMADELPALVEAGQPQASLELALTMTTNHDDTHPCLRERLEALGESPRVPPPPAEVASTTLFGSARYTLARDLDEMWATAVQQPWADQHESMQRGAKRLARLDAEGGPPVDRAPKALELGLLMEQVRGSEAALAYLRTVLEAHPSDGPIRFTVARLLLQDDREEGLEVLEPLFDAPREAVGSAHHLASDFFRRRGQVDEARQHLLQALEWEDEQGGTHET